MLGVLVHLTMCLLVCLKFLHEKTRATSYHLDGDLGVQAGVVMAGCVPASNAVTSPEQYLLPCMQHSPATAR